MGATRNDTHRWQQPTPQETAVLVGVHLPEAWSAGPGGDADTAELRQLVETAGGDVAAVVEQRRQRPVARTFIGKGKLQELTDTVAEYAANLVVFDNDLTPAQGRNLERSLDVNVIDRTELILDIFANHARTRQARLQVEMAQLQYLLPRLTRLWSHLERQAGGIGTRGPGETQLETDRRLIGRRIARLKREIAGIETDRRIQVKGRDEIYRVALVGYTNAGKSTLMNGLTDAGVLVRDQLFATLDATTRRVETDERHRFLLTDTVGFIRRLPHHLVESFQATLREVAEADMLVHVVDAGSADPDHQIATVDGVLAQIVPSQKPTLLVFNKIDRVDSASFGNRYERRYPSALFISGRTRDGADTLLATITARLQATEQVYSLRVPGAALYHLGSWFRTGAVLDQQWKGDICTVTLRMRPGEYRRLLARAPVVAADPGES
jgi:GTP-binding protein HflX